VKAYHSGPATLTSPLMSINILLVVFMSTMIFHEHITSLQFMGITCIFIAVALLSANSNSDLIKNRMWILFVILAILFIFMREGSLKIAHETGVNNLHVLFYGYLLASCLSSIKLLSNKKTLAATTTNKENDTTSTWHRPAFLLGAMIGLFSATGMGLLAYAITHGPAAVIIPIFSARNFVVILLFIIFFKEKLLPLQWAAVSLLMLGIFFLS
jgi:drug/metabolite transporter (DMT)-like permease